MAGVKGRSGGKRAGAGRKPEPQPIGPPADGDDALAYLLKVMQDETADARLRVRAAIAAAKFQQAKKDPGGKKDEQEERASRAVKKFAPGQAPRLVSSR